MKPASLADALEARDKEIARLQAQIERVRHAAQEALTNIEDVEAFAIVTALLRALAPGTGPKEGE